MSRYLFVGEKPSRRARTMNVSWENGRLAARSLFDALAACGIEPAQHRFTNLFGETPRAAERLNARKVARIRAQIENDTIVVALGSKVSRALTSLGIAHLQLVHPAARGSIRKKAVYAAHVAAALHARSNPAERAA